MFKFKKLFVASLAATAFVFSASICALGAQIDSLSLIDNTIYAQFEGAENARFYVVDNSEGLLSDVFFKDVAIDGTVELEIGEASEYDLFLWDKDSLAPVFAPYKLIDGRAYAKGSETPVPEFEFSGYTFDQEDDVMIVSAVSDTEIKGFKAGIETTYSLTDDVAVLGLSDSFSDIVPGSVVLIGTNKKGDCAAVELLASLGLPIDPDSFEADFGVYDASDGSGKYKNIVTEMYSKSGSNITTYNLPDTTKTTYKFESSSSMCYRVGIAMNGETPVITATGKNIGTYPSIFESTADYHNYLYLRYNSETGKVKECVFYCVPKNYNPGGGDEEYSPIFGLEPIVIIE